jgi:myo-inositol 2-dehydrogenase/D-chiro-inositol 1-dehydrogenase
MNVGMNVGIIGAGGMGGRHARNLHDKVVGAHVAGVFDIDLARMERVADDCDSARTYSDPLQLVEDERIEAVLIASPDETHADFVLACLREGKPVLCEKPLAATASEAWRVVEAEASLGRKLLSLGFMRRFDPEHVSLNEVVKSGAIGRPVMFKGVHRNASIGIDFPGEAVVSQAAIHDIDSSRWLLGQEIREVYVRGVRVDSSLNADVFDLVSLHFALSGDCLASIEVFVSARYGYEVSAEVIGEKGAAVTRQPDRVVVRGDGERALPVPADWLIRFQDAYVAELEDWVHSLSGGLFAGADAWDGYVSLLVSDACLLSLESGRPEPVIIPERQPLYQVSP